MDATTITKETEAMLAESQEEMDKAEKEFEILKAHITNELEAEMSELSDDTNNWLAEIQPPMSIIRAAAVAAAEVFMAFERGYRMER